MTTLTKEQTDFLMAGTNWEALKKLSDKEIEIAVLADADWDGIPLDAPFSKCEIKKIAA